MKDDRKAQKAEERAAEAAEQNEWLIEEEAKVVAAEEAKARGTGVTPEILAQARENVRKKMGL